MSPNPTSFQQMDSWNITDPHPEQVAQGIQKSAGMLLDLASRNKSKASENATDAPSTASGSTTRAQRKAAPKARQLADDEMVDEYGYPYTLDGNGQPVYDIGSNQVG